MDTKSKSRRTTESGMMIVVVAFVVVLMAGLSLGFLTTGLSERQSVIHHETSMEALEITEMGLVKAESMIRGQTAKDSDSISGAYADGTFEVGMEHDPDRPRRWVLTGEASKGHSQRRVEVELRIFFDGLFNHGMFGKRSLDIRSTSTTDSYDSRLGTYASQAVNVDAYGVHADGDAHVGSNGSVTLSGTGIVRGDAIPGPLSTTTVNGTSSVDGDQIPLQDELDVPDIRYAVFADALANNNNASIDGTLPGVTYNAATYKLSVKAGATLVLDPGTYFFTDLVLTGGSNIVLTGPVKFYVTGRFNLGGGSILNSSMRAKDLQVYAHPYALPAGHAPGTHQLIVNGQSATAMAVYAPERDVLIDGGAPFFGAVVGRDVVIQGDSQFHYDRELGDIFGESTATVERLYWRELSVPAR